jgi:hypothetical protein
MTDPISPSVWRSARRNTAQKQHQWPGLAAIVRWSAPVKAVSMPQWARAISANRGSENLATLRRLALNRGQPRGSKGSMKGKLKKAGWDNAFLTGSLPTSPILKCDSPGNPVP